MMMEEICMFFYQSSQVVFLFKDWNVRSAGPYIACLIATFFMGFLLEIVTLIIQQLKLRIESTSEPHNQINNVSKPFVDNTGSEASAFKTVSVERSRKERIIIRAYIAMAFLVQLFLAYTIMLIVMTFNFLLFLAPIFGMVLGFILIQVYEEYIKKISSGGIKSRL